MSVPAFPSANSGPRRDGAVPDLIVIHYTAMHSHAAALARLCDAKAEVSAHYLIGSDGAVDALVEESRRAWHAGAGAWGGVSDVNSRSIGIELGNDGRSPFAERQMHALEGLLAEVMQRWTIPPHRVIGHSDMAPRRKGDPGARFDWRRLALTGLAVWPEVADARLPFAEAARTFGYPVVSEDDLLDAFRLHFRPWARGPMDEVDLALANDLAQRFPVDARVAGA